MTTGPMQAIQLLIGGGEEKTGPARPGSFTSFRETSIAEQGLLLPTQAAHILRISKQAVQSLIERKRLTSWEFFDKCFVSAREVAERADGPRLKGGRPKKAA